MPITQRTRELLAKLLGMLGTNNENEALTAVRFLKRKMEAESVSFGDLANIIREGSAPTRTVVVEKRRKPNRAAYIARVIIRRGGARLTRSERLFLEDIIYRDNTTGGNFDLTTKQANWLGMCYKTYVLDKAPMFKTKQPKHSAAYEEECAAMGLGERPDADQGPAADFADDPLPP